MTHSCERLSMPGRIAAGKYADGTVDNILVVLDPTAVLCWLYPTSTNWDSIAMCLSP